MRVLSFFARMLTWEITRQKIVEPKVLNQSSTQYPLPPNPPLGEDGHCWNWLIHWHINVEKLHVPMQSMPEILWRYVTYCCWIVFNTSQSVISVLILLLAVVQAFVTFGDSQFFSEQCYLLLQILIRIIYWLFLKILPWAPISVLCESFYMDSFSLWFLFRRLLIVTFVIFVYFSCI